MLVPRNQRQAAAMGLAASFAPAVAPLLRRGAQEAYNYMTAPVPRKGTVARIMKAAHEPKNQDLYVSQGLSNSTTPYLACLNNVDQGTGGTNRTGRQYSIERLLVDMQLELDGAQLTGDVVRIIILVDKETKAGFPSTADMLTNNGSLLTQSVSQYDFDNVPSRFKVLLDRRVTLNPIASPTTTTLVPLLVPVEINLPLKQRVHCYNTTGGGIADIDSGSLLMFVYSLKSTVAHATTMTYNSRIVFRDL